MNNKQLYDKRSRSRKVDSRPLWQRLLFPMPKADRPNWKWRGTGRYEYTTSPEAAAYVRKFATMQAAKEAARQARLTPIIIPAMVKKTDTMLLIEAASRVPARAAVV